MSVEIITIIMSSTVISVFISSILSFIQNRKNSNLQYITLERKEWREQLRLISEEICNSKINNIKKALVKLKVRINAYGRNDNTDFEDRHIWSLIELTETVSRYPGHFTDYFEDCKQLLIIAISMQLKYDWERAKWEVRGDVNSILEKIFLVIFGFSFMGLLYSSIGFDIYFTPLFSIAIFIIIKYIYKNMSDYLDTYNYKEISNLQIKRRLIDKLNIAMIVLLGVISTFFYTYNRPLQISIVNILITLFGILSYSLIVIAPYLIWFYIWNENSKKKVINQMRYLEKVEVIKDETSNIIGLLEARMLKNGIITQEEFQLRKDIRDKM